MTERSLRLPDFLDHILTAIQRIETYTAGMQKETFLANLLVQDAVIRNFEIIGEASKSIERISPEFVAENAEIPFLFAYDMRNVLAHAYHKVDLNILWRTLERDLPVLKQQIVIVRRRLDA
jgi:uncharacterized protein with HEPN domain